VARVTDSERRGEHGIATWRTLHRGELRLRSVEDSPGYVADHWCAKSHVVFCLDGGARRL
jgi:hypothetical protein